MALSRIGGSTDFAVLFARSSYAASSSSPRVGDRSNAEGLHATTIRQYPEAPALPLPTNVSEIFNIETGRFAPERARDIAAPVYLNSKLSGNPSFANGYDRSIKMQQLDARHDSYDCFGAVSLNGIMQTNVPKPFTGGSRSTYLNMPGGMWARDGKYLADILNKNHFKMDQMRYIKRHGGLNGLVSKNRTNVTSLRCYSTGATTTTNPTSSPQQDEKPNDGNQKTEPSVKPKLSKKERFQLAIRDYGRIVIVFHVGISLISLGSFYALVSSGLDVTPVIHFITGGPDGPDAETSKELTNNVLSQGSTFLIAYGVHKLFAPLRITLTLGCTPIIVRALRRRGLLKPPANWANPS